MKLANSLINFTIIKTTININYKMVSNHNIGLHSLNRKTLIEKTELIRKSQKEYFKCTQLTGKIVQMIPHQTCFWFK